jgi:hypothetical protein
MRNPLRFMHDPSCFMRRLTLKQSLWRYLKTSLDSEMVLFRTRKLQNLTRKMQKPAWKLQKRIDFLQKAGARMALLENKSAIYPYRDIILQIEK